MTDRPDDPEVVVGETPPRRGGRSRLPERFQPDVIMAIAAGGALGPRDAACSRGIENIGPTMINAEVEDRSRRVLGPPHIGSSLWQLTP